MEHIVSTPGVAFGKPRIAGTRISVRDVVIDHLHNGMPLELIATDFNIPLAAVYAAISYYYDHKAEMDTAMEETDRFVEEMMRTHPSALNKIAEPV